MPIAQHPMREDYFTSCPLWAVGGEEAGIAVFGCPQNRRFFYTIERAIEEDRYVCLINGSPSSAILEAALGIYADIAEAVIFAIGSLEAVVVVGFRRGNLPIVSEHEARNISLL